MKNWLLPHYCKKIGQALILLMLILIVASIYIEASFIDSNPWLIDAAQAALYIAMALISEPQILFLDEPTLGLDVIARHDLWEVIRSLKGKITIILTTHYMEEAEFMCDRIVMINKGVIIAAGTPEQLKEETATTNLRDAFFAYIEGGADDEL